MMLIISWISAVERVLCSACLAKKLNRKIIGLDISPEGFAKAHRKCKRFDVCYLIECIKGDAHHMGMFKCNKFDAAILLYSLHHMDNPEPV
ncbi:MAG: class I SAM-dependent methyltransferase [Candidatus Aminicenantales bacterium]